MESRQKVPDFCRFSKEKCPHLRNNMCTFSFHRSEAELNQQKNVIGGIQQKPEGIFNEFLNALSNPQDMRNFGAHPNIFESPSRGGFRGGRGNNILASTNQQQFRQIVSQQNYPLLLNPQKLEEGKIAGPQTQNESNQSNFFQSRPLFRKVIPVVPANNVMPQSSTFNSEQCRFGKNCIKKEFNTCKFLHDDTNVINSKKDQVPQNSMSQRPNLQNFTQSQSSRDSKNQKCMHGPKCRYLLTKSCRFSHNEDQEESKRGEHIQDSSLDQRMKGMQRNFTDKNEELKAASKGNQDKDQTLVKGKFFHFLELKNLLDIENDRDFMIGLTEIKGGILHKLNNTNIDREMPNLMISFLERLLKQKESEICRDYIHNFIESNFFAKLSDCILKNGSVVTSNEIQKKFKFMMASINTMNQLMGMYQSQIDKFQTTITALFTDSFMFKMQIHNESQKAQLQAAIDLLMQRYQETLKAKDQSKEKPKKVVEQRKIDESYKNEPVQDFKDVEVVPGIRELEVLNAQQLKENRRKMPEEGDLISPHNYLDIVFRLLHEDAISDLRNGIGKMRELQSREANQKEVRKTLKENQVKIYDQLTIQSLEVAEGSRCIQFRIPMSKKHLADWRITKKLMGGSLVVLSHDGFKTFVVGLLKHGDSRQRNEMHQMFGYVPVNIEILKQSSGESFNNLEFAVQFKGQVFDMIESSAYFESYRYVLIQLQEMDQWQEFPMQQFLVHGNKRAVQQPDYLQNMMIENSDEIKETIIKMGLDNSQKLALNHALNSNFALIQGPPGTGKTYIGVQIVRLLIKYKSYWNQDGPILLVTYTNHALEQFLHFIKDITKRIVRIGGKQSTDELSEFSLQNRLRNEHFNYGSQFYEARNGERDAQVQITHLKAQLLKYEFKCISSLISDEDHEGICDLMSKLGRQFMSHLNSCIANMFLDINSSDLVKNRLQALRMTTQMNILVLFWLGIIDLSKFIEFIIQDEIRRANTNLLRSQFDTKNIQMRQIQRQIDEKIKAININNKNIFDINQSIEKGASKQENNQASKDGEEKKDDKAKLLDLNNPKFNNLHNRLRAQTKLNNDLENEIFLLREQEASVKLELDAISFQIQAAIREINTFGFIPDQQAAQNEFLLDKDDIIDMDQRQLDYDDKRLDMDSSVDALLNVIKDIINPSYMSDIFEGAETISDCIQQMSAITYQNKEEADQDLQEFLNTKQNLFDQTAFTLYQRWKLNNFYLNELIDKTISQLNNAINKYQKSYKLKKNIESIKAEKFLKSQDIIAMTTTARAKNSQFLRGIEFPIVIVEEAAEVFEAHILTSLTKNTKHVILIGDHEQLKPNAAVYELDKQYNLSMSLFERLIKNGLEHSTLSIQRRMRPEISKIMNFIYSDLQDYPDVEKYPKVSGLTSNVFFFDHKFKEEELSALSSKMNIEEAKIIVRFTQYILQQKQYQPKNITILTLYAGQLIKIRKLMQENPLYNQGMRQVKVTNVDNYQGEENEIIILSLVRSNSFNNIGFLKISNRVCVALSRAKHGLYIFGNSSCLISGQNPLQLWVKVINYLKENKFIGDEIQVRCDQHGNLASIKQLDDFVKVPEGGCSQLCRLRLECGHTCESLCHPIKRTDEDPTGHFNTKCIKACARDLLCGHPCTKLCHECKNQSQPCVTKIEVIMQPCQHQQEVLCHLKDKATCKADCGKILKCGHVCKKTCSTKCDDPWYPCKTQVDKQLPCGHTIEDDCYKKPEDVVCYRTCSFILPCGHQCLQKCHECKKTGHGNCQQKCGRNLVCGHLCKEPCIKNCPPCLEKCKTQCPHSQCAKICKEVCILCTEPCQIGCKHSKCTKKCSEPCNNEACDLPCPLLLPCEHPCISLCGMKCPDLCKLCSPDDPNFDEAFQFAERDVKYVKLDDCGHLFDHEFLDGWMKAQENSEAVKFKECPKCKTPIMSCSRYMNTINKTLNDVNAIKALILANDKKIQEDFSRIKAQLQKQYDNLTAFNQTEDYFKQLYALFKDLKIQFNFAEKQRDTNLMNQVVVNINFFSKLFTIARLNRQHDMSLLDKIAVTKVFNDLSKRFLDVNEQAIEKVSKVLDELQVKYNDKQFMEEIMKATDIGRGHWNKCPNGHLYAIGECGGAMETSRCPDCNAVIGGSNHLLAQGNTFASELGGHSAWDPQGFDARVARGEINLNNI